MTNPETLALEPARARPLADLLPRIAVFVSDPCSNPVSSACRFAVIVFDRCDSLSVVHNWATIPSTSSASSPSPRRPASITLPARRHMLLQRRRRWP